MAIHFYIKKKKSVKQIVPLNLVWAGASGISLCYETVKHTFGPVIQRDVCLLPSSIQTQNPAIGEG